MTKSKVMVAQMIADIEKRALAIGIDKDNRAISKLFGYAPNYLKDAKVKGNKISRRFYTALELHEEIYALKKKGEKGKKGNYNEEE